VIPLRRPKRAESAEISLSERELLEIVETAAQGGNWQAARWLIERQDRVELARPARDDPFAEFGLRPRIPG